jgi:hypothetical protein
VKKVGKTCFLHQTKFKVKNIISYIQHRVLRILWKISLKKEFILCNEKIYYLPVNKFFLYNSSRVSFSEGMCLVHRKTKSLMIFLSHKECGDENFKFTLYHEFIEGNYLLQDKDFARKIKPLLTQKHKNLKEKFPEVLLKFEESLRAGQDKGHLIALIFELNLALEELSKPDFEKHLQFMLSKRL